jgi:hypothetical protein
VSQVLRIQYALTEKNKALMSIRGGEMMKKKAIPFFAALLVTSIAVVASTMPAATTPAGWKVLVDKTKNCQISVPPDWVVSTFSPSVADSADKKANLTMHSAPAQSLDQVKTIMEGMYPPTKVIEDSKSRVWYAYKAPSVAVDSLQVDWYVGIPAKGNVCGAQITFKVPSMEPMMKQIAESMSAAK